MAKTFNEYQVSIRVAPYFIYYFDDIKKIIERKHKFLIDLNNEILIFLIDMLNIKTELRNTDKYVKSYSKKLVITEQKKLIITLMNTHKYLEINLSLI